MGCIAEEPLREVEGEEQAQRLLQALSKDLPHSIHLVNSVENLFEWKRTGRVDLEPALQRHAVYRYKGDGDSSDGDATVVTVTRVEPYLVVVCIHTTDETGTALRRVLADSSLLPWGENTMFESVHERCVPALLEEARARGDLSPGLYPTDKMFLPKEKALNMDVSCPPGYVLLPLQAKHHVPVEATWYVGRGVHGALKMIESTIVRNQGLSWGVFPEDKTEGDPAAHILGEGGSLRILYTSDDHRRKGLGALVTRMCCRAVAERGKDLHANIVYPNPASEATFTKLGFKRICECTFVVYHAPPRATAMAERTS